MGENAFSVANDVFVQFRGGQVPENFLGVADAMVLQAHFMFQYFLRHVPCSIKKGKIVWSCAAKMAEQTDFLGGIKIILNLVHGNIRVVGFERFCI